MAADDAQLGDGAAAGRGQQAAGDPARLQPFAQGVGLGIVTHQGRQGCAGAQRGDVQCDVARPADAQLVALHLDHRHGGLGRDARGGAMPVAVEHDVAGDEHMSSAEIGQVEEHGGVSCGRFCIKLPGILHSK